MDKSVLAIICILTLCIIGIIVQICDTYKQCQSKYKKQNNVEKETKYKVKLEQQIDNYKKEAEEVLNSYYRRNTEGNEDPAEIWLIRDANKLIDKLTEAYRLNNEMVNVFLRLDDVYVNINGEYVKWEPTEELTSRGYDLTPED